MKKSAILNMLRSIERHNKLYDDQMLALHQEGYLDSKFLMTSKALNFLRVNRDVSEGSFDPVFGLS